MSTDRLILEPVLPLNDYQSIDRFCMKNQRVDALSDISQFLKNRFGLLISLDPDIIEGFTADSSNLPGHAHGVCRPTTERECAVILRACFSAGIPMTLSAGRSNLTGSATPEGGVLISMINMVKPKVTVDSTKLQVTSPVGVVFEEMRQKILSQTGDRFYFPVDPTSREDALVGGTLACNASGFTPGERGAIREWVAQIHFLFPNGYRIVAHKGDFYSRNGTFILCREGEDVLWPVPTYVRPALKNASGPFSSPDGKLDFVDLVVGSEGLFGLITSCTLNLARKPSHYLDLFFSLPEEKQALQFLNYMGHYLHGDFGRLSAFEYFGVNCRKYMNHDNRLFTEDNQVAVYLQIPLEGISTDEAAEQWFDILTNADCGISDDAILLMDTGSMQRVFLEARHSMPANIVELVRQRGTHTIMTDTVVPFDHFPEFLEYTHTILNSANMDYLTFGHLGDCHLHITLLPEKRTLDCAVDLYDKIIEKSARFGGVYSGEHGTGKRKRKDFLKCYGPAAIDEVKQCKAVVDPLFLLNRGNVYTAG